MLLMFQKRPLCGSQKCILAWSGDGRKASAACGSGSVWFLISLFDFGKSPFQHFACWFHYIEIGESKLPLRKWFIAIYLLSTTSKGMSLVQVAKHVGICQKTAWFMAHRIASCLFPLVFPFVCKGNKMGL
jgi:hypothetical protein